MAVASNRVSPEFQEKLHDIALSHMDTEIDYLEQLFEIELPDNNNANWKHSAAQRAQNIRAQMQLAKDLAQWASGAVHPLSSNSSEEKKLADALVKKTRKKLSAKGFDLSLTNKKVKKDK